MEFSIDELYDVVPNIQPPVEVDVGTIYKSKTIDAYLTSTINDLNKEYTKLQVSLKDFGTIKNIHITKIHQSRLTFTNNLKNAQSILTKMIDINNIINSITQYAELEKQLECDRIYSSELSEPTTEDYGDRLRSHAEFAAYSKNPFLSEYKFDEPIKSAVIQFDDLSQVPQHEDFCKKDMVGFALHRNQVLKQAHDLHEENVQKQAEDKPTKNVVIDHDDLYYAQQHEQYEKLHEDFCKKEMLSKDSEDDITSDTRRVTCNNSNCTACRQNTGPCPALIYRNASTFNGLMPEPIHLE